MNFFFPKAPKLPKGYEILNNEDPDESMIQEVPEFSLENDPLHKSKDVDVDPFYKPKKIENVPPPKRFSKEWFKKHYFPEIREFYPFDLEQEFVDFFYGKNFSRRLTFTLLFSSFVFPTYLITSTIYITNIFYLIGFTLIEIIFFATSLILFYYSINRPFYKYNFAKLELYIFLYILSIAIYASFRDCVYSFITGSVTFALCVLVVRLRMFYTFIIIFVSFFCVSTCQVLSGWFTFCNSVFCENPIKKNMPSDTAYWILGYFVIIFYIFTIMFNIEKMQRKFFIGLKTFRIKKKRVDLCLFNYNSLVKWLFPEKTRKFFQKHIFSATQPHMRKEKLADFYKLKSSQIRAFQFNQKFTFNRSICVVLSISNFRHLFERSYNNEKYILNTKVNLPIISDLFSCRGFLALMSSIFLTIDEICDYVGLIKTYHFEGKLYAFMDLTEETEGYTLQKGRHNDLHHTHKEEIDEDRERYMKKDAIFDEEMFYNYVSGTSGVDKILNKKLIDMEKVVYAYNDGQRYGKQERFYIPKKKLRKVLLFGLLVNGFIKVRFPFLMPHVVLASGRTHLILSKKENMSMKKQLFGPALYHALFIDRYASEYNLYVSDSIAVQSNRMVWFDDMEKEERQFKLNYLYYKNRRKFLDKDLSSVAPQGDYFNYDLKHCSFQFVKISGWKHILKKVIIERTLLKMFKIASARFFFDLMPNEKDGRRKVKRAECLDALNSFYAFSLLTKVPRTADRPKFVKNVPIKFDTFFAEVERKTEELHENKPVAYPNLTSNPGMLLYGVDYMELTGKRKKKKRPKKRVYEATATVIRKKEMEKDYKWKELRVFDDKDRDFRLQMMQNRLRKRRNSLSGFMKNKVMRCMKHEAVDVEDIRVYRGRVVNDPPTHYQKEIMLEEAKRVAREEAKKKKKKLGVQTIYFTSQYYQMYEEMMRKGEKRKKEEEIEDVTINTRQRSYSDFCTTLYCDKEMKNEKRDDELHEITTRTEYTQPYTTLLLRIKEKVINVLVRINLYFNFGYTREAVERLGAKIQQLILFKISDLVSYHGDHDLQFHKYIIEGHKHNYKSFPSNDYENLNRVRELAYNREKNKLLYSPIFGCFYPLIHELQFFINSREIRLFSINLFYFGLVCSSGLSLLFIMLNYREMKFLYSFDYFLYIAMFSGSFIVLLMVFALIIIKYVFKHEIYKKGTLKLLLKHENKYKIKEFLIDLIKYNKTDSLVLIIGVIFWLFNMFSVLFFDIKSTPFYTEPRTYVEIPEVYSSFELKAVLDLLIITILLPPANINLRFFIILCYLFCCFLMLFGMNFFFTFSAISNYFYASSAFFDILVSSFSIMLFNLVVNRTTRSIWTRRIEIRRTINHLQNKKSDFSNWLALVMSEKELKQLDIIKEHLILRPHHEQNKGNIKVNLSEINRPVNRHNQILTEKDSIELLYFFGLEHSMHYHKCLMIVGLFFVDGLTSSMLHFDVSIMHLLSDLFTIEFASICEKHGFEIFKSSENEFAFGRRFPLVIEECDVETYNTQVNSLTRFEKKSMYGHTRRREFRLERIAAERLIKKYQSEVRNLCIHMFHMMNITNGRLKFLQKTSRGGKKFEKMKKLFDEKVGVKGGLAIDTGLVFSRKHCKTGFNKRENELMLLEREIKEKEEEEERKKKEEEMRPKKKEKKKKGPKKEKEKGPEKKNVKEKKGKKKKGKKKEAEKKNEKEEIIVIEEENDKKKKKKKTKKKKDEGNEGGDGGANNLPRGTRARQRIRNNRARQRRRRMRNNRPQPERIRFDLEDRDNISFFLPSLGVTGRAIYTARKFAVASPLNKVTLMEKTLRLKRSEMENMKVIYDPRFDLGNMDLSKKECSNMINMGISFGHVEVWVVSLPCKIEVKKEKVSVGGDGEEGKKEKVVVEGVKKEEGKKEVREEEIVIEEKKKDKKKKKKKEKEKKEVVEEEDVVMYEDEVVNGPREIIVIEEIRE